VLAFVSNPGFSALRLVAVHIGQAMMQQHPMNSIMRDMLSVLELDDLFQSSCAKFCSLWTSSISFSDSSSKVFFYLPNFLMFRGILVFVQCIQTRSTEDGLNFISAAILLVLSPLILARMIYLIFLSVSFTTLFFFPMPL
jgi:hypothetical protein